MIASIEGRRGQPRPRPPYPAEDGLWGCPTLINNVETFANIAPIIRNGSEWFAEIGTDKSKGTKVFALAGRVKNTGLIEVPMGIPLRDIIFDIGGGIPEGKQFKAVQTGGPSGGCIPEDHLDVPRRLRFAQCVGFHHGVRRDDRHGRNLGHGGCRPLFHGILYDGILWKMCSLPCRNRANSRFSEQDSRRKSDAA